MIETLAVAGAGIGLLTAGAIARGILKHNKRLPA